MAITVNGQPTNNTVVRLDGVSQINQFFQQIQAYSPSLEAIETVSVVTSSFDADQGMAGGAVGQRAGQERHEQARRVAVRTRHRLPDEVEELLPAGRRPEGHRQRAHLRRHGRRAHRPQQDVLLRQRRAARASAPTAGNALSNSGANGLRSLPTMAMREGNFAGTGTVLYDPRTGSRQRHRADAVRVRELSRAQRRPPVRSSTRATTFRRTASIRSRRTS